MGSFRLVLHVELGREDDGRWFAVVVDIPGVMAYGTSEDDALAKVKVLSMQVVTDRLDRGEDPLTGIELQRDKPRSEFLAAFSGLEFTAQLAC